MSKATNKVPRATIHKQILDLAATNRNAPVDKLAEEVSGATPVLVERVLDEYGDPGAQEADSATATDTSNKAPKSKPSAHETPPTMRKESLTDAQHEALKAIYENPDATQAELASQFNITSASINQRLNSIDGFEWDDRQEFVEALWEPSDNHDPRHNADNEAAVEPQDTARESGSEPANPTHPMKNGEEPVKPRKSQPAASSTLENGAAAKSDVTAQLSAIERDLTELSQAVLADDQPNTTETAGPAADVELPAELVHKVVHACMQSEQLSESEELQVLRALLP